MKTKRTSNSKLNSKLNLKLKVALTLGAFGTLGCALGAMSGPAAWASVPNGDFHGNFHSVDGSGTTSADILIESATEGGVPVNYGLVLRNRSAAALFRIEEVGDGTEAWIRITQTADGLVGSDQDDDAAYSGVVTQDGDGARIALSPNGNGNCNESISARADNSMSWLGLPDDGSSLGFSDGGESVTLFSTLLMGNFSIGKQAYSGTFALDQVIPGIAALHPESLDPDAQSGRSLQRPIAAMIALVRTHGFWGSSDKLELIQISNGSQACLDATQSIQQN